MKRVLVIMLAASFVIGSNNLFAQLRDVPSEVTNSLKAKYPDAADVSWDDKITSFQASFKSNGAAYQARFSKDGEWKESEKAILLEDAPAAVKNSFNSTKFKDWTMQNVAMLEMANGGTEYRIYVHNNSVKRKYLFFNEEGKLIKESFKL